MELSGFAPFVSSLRGKRVLIVTHSSADIDAISSAGILWLALKPSCEPVILVPDRINLYAKALAENTGIRYSLNENPEFYDAMIFVEFNSYDLLGSFSQKAKDFAGPKMLIDHHLGSVDRIAPPKFTIINPKSVSATELLYDLLCEAKMKITKKMALLIAAGLITDSAAFTVASPHSFEAMASVSRIAEKSVQEIVSLFELEGNPSEKVAKLRSGQRARIYGLGEFVCAATEIGSFEAESSSMLVRMGADIAFACAFEKGNARVSARASIRFLKKTGLSLASLMDSLSKSFEGRGGGHKGAAAFNGKAKSGEEILSKCVSLSLEEVRKKFPNAQFKEYK